jgi:Flp pilus assembly protein TadD
MVRRMICLIGLSCVAAGTASAQEPESARECVRGAVSSPSGPVVDAIVTLEAFGLMTTARTTGRGQFLFCGVQQGTYVVSVTAPGFDPVRTQVFAGPEISVELVPRFKFAVPPPAANAVSVESLKVPPPARKQLDRFLEAAAKKDWQKSLTALKKAVEVYPRYVDAWANLGVVYTQLKDYPAAEDSFLKAQDIRPQDSLIHRKLGYVYMLQEKWDPALKQLQAAESLNPKDALTRAYLGFVFNRLEKPADAVSHLQAALKLQPDLQMANYGIGFAQMKLNRTEEARASFEHYLELDSASSASEEVRAALQKLHRGQATINQ